MLPENCFYLSKKDCTELHSSALFGYAIFEDAIAYGTHGLQAYYAQKQTPTFRKKGDLRVYFYVQMKLSYEQTVLVRRSCIYFVKDLIGLFRIHLCCWRTRQPKTINYLSMNPQLLVSI